MFTANKDGKGHKNITEPSVTFTVTQSKSSSQQFLGIFSLSFRFVFSRLLFLFFV